MSTATLERPADALGVKASIKTDADLSKAVTEHCLLLRMSERIAAECDAEVQRIKLDYAGRLKMVVGKSDVSLADRLAKLEASIEEYATLHKERLCAAGTKYIELTNGRIAWKTVPAELLYAEAKGKQNFLARLEVLCGVYEKALKLLRKLVLFGAGKEAVTCEDVVSVKVEPKLSGIKNAFKSGRLSEHQASQLGFELSEETEKFSLTPAKNPVVSQSERPAA